MYNDPAAETFGSVYYPQENGGGGRYYGRGGGTVRIVADRVQVDGAIRANGQTSNDGSAGGSVWITTGALAGVGVIEAIGGNETYVLRGFGRWRRDRHRVQLGGVGFDGAGSVERAGRLVEPHRRCRDGLPAGS